MMPASYSVSGTDLNEAATVWLRAQMTDILVCWDNYLPMFHRDASEWAPVLSDVLSVKIYCIHFYCVSNKEAAFQNLCSTLGITVFDGTDVLL